VLVEGLDRHLDVEFEVWTLPARKWKWRMRGSALHFAERAREVEPDFDGVFVTSMTNAAELKGMLDPGWSRLPWTVYFHENQLRYPVQHFDARDHHFAWTNVVTACAANRLYFNSEFNRDSLLEDLRELLKKMPDARPNWALESVATRSEILPVPIEDQAIDRAVAGSPRRGGPCHIVWNHRWEFDKGPDTLLDCVRALAESNLDFRMSILGESFQERPAIFDEIHEALGDRVAHFGRIEDRSDYLGVLASADVALSTAVHEFQGLAILEAAACGTVPLVPDELAYREIWPEEWRAHRGDLPTRLLDRVRDVQIWRDVDPREIARSRGWSKLSARWNDVFNESDCNPPTGE
jgi:glycosyltransferase involved in cell wall biosynthesis